MIYTSSWNQNDLFVKSRFTIFKDHEERMFIFPEIKQTKYNKPTYLRAATRHTQNFGAKQS